MKRYCAVIPAYNEAGRIGSVVRRVKARLADVLVVDDGSADGTADEAGQAGAEVLRLSPNQGKGKALAAGFAHATGKGFECVITLDADGQHDPDDIPVFIAEYEKSGTPVLVGSRMADPRGMPLVRKLTNRFMSRLLSWRMGVAVPDTQSGYRLYRCDRIPRVSISARYAAESEILLRLAARGVAIGAVPIRVIYGDEKSKINPIRDTIRFFRMLREVERDIAREAGVTRPA